MQYFDLHLAYNRSAKGNSWRVINDRYRRKLQQRLRKAGMSLKKARKAAEDRTGWTRAMRLEAWGIVRLHPVRQAVEWIGSSDVIQRCWVTDVQMNEYLTTEIFAKDGSEAATNFWVAVCPVADDGQPLDWLGPIVEAHDDASGCATPWWRTGQIPSIIRLKSTSGRWVRASWTGNGWLLNPIKTA